MPPAPLELLDPLRKFIHLLSKNNSIILLSPPFQNCVQRNKSSESSQRFYVCVCHICHTKEIKKILVTHNRQKKKKYPAHCNVCWVLMQRVFQSEDKLDEEQLE